MENGEPKTHPRRIEGGAPGYKGLRVGVALADLKLGHYTGNGPPLQNRAGSKVEESATYFSRKA